MKPFLFSLAVLMQVFLQGCASTANPEVPLVESSQEKVAAEVEAMLFSGRHNPQWTLSEEQVSALLMQLGQLESINSSQAASKLGYNGLVVKSRPDGVIQFQVELFDGIVRYREGSRERTLNDNEQAVEHWLINTGSTKIAKGDYELLSKISSEQR